MLLVLPPTVTLTSLATVEGLNFAAQYPEPKNDRDGAYESNGDGFGLSATCMSAKVLA